MSAGEETATMRLLCSHGGRLVPCGPDGGLRYVGGETRALVVPHDVTFCEMRARLAEKAGDAGAVSAVKYRLADEGLDEDLLVSVTCDEELAHMRDEYDRLKATRPTASFRVFVSTAGAGVQQRRPPVAPPTMRRARSEQELAGRSRPCPPAGHAAASPMRRVHSAQELAGGNLSYSCFYDRRRQNCCCCCHRCRDDHCAPLPPPARLMSQLPSMSKNVNGARPAGGQEASPAVSTAKVTDPVVFTAKAMEEATTRDAMVAMELDNRRACWEFE